MSAFSYSIFHILFWWGNENSFLKKKCRGNMLSRILEQRKMIDIFLATRMACRDNAGGDCLIDETLDSTTSAAAAAAEKEALLLLQNCMYANSLHYCTTL